MLLTGLVASGLLGLFPPFIRFIVVFSLVTYVPGEILRGRMLGDIARAPEHRLPLSVLLGLCLFATLAVLGRAVGLSFSAWVDGLQLAVFAVCGYFFVDDIVRKREGRGSPPEAGRRRLSSAAVLGLALVIALFFYAAPPGVNPSGDAYDHIGYVRTIAAENELAPAGVLAPKVGEAAIKDDPRKGAFHPLLAAVCSLGDLEPWQAWVWLPVVLAPLAVLAFLAFALALLPGVAYAAFAVVLLLMFGGGLGREFLGTVAYGQHLSMVFFWVMFVLAIGYGLRQDRHSLIAALALLVGGSLIHVDVLLHFALLYLSLLVFCRWFGLRLSAVIRLGIASAICGLAVLGWKLAVSYGPGNYLHLHPQGLLYFVNIGDALFVASPVEVLKKNGLLFLMGVCLLPGLLLVRRHRRFAKMSLALSLPPVLIAFNPWVAPFVYDKAGYLLHRFLLNIPAFVVTALVLGSLVAWARRGNLLAKAAAFAILFVWAQVFLLGFGAWRANMRSVRFSAAPRLTPAFENVVGFINARTPRGSVVLTDPVSGYALSAFTHAKVIAVLHQHGNPNDPHAFDRLTAVRTALSPYSTQIDAIRAVDEYGVDYVLLNGSFRQAVHDFLADWDPVHMKILERKFGSLKTTFRPVYEADGIVVYQVLDERPASFNWFPEGTFFRPPDVEWSRCEDSALGALRITRVSIDPREALAGEKVQVTVAYEKTGDVDEPLPLRLHIRLEDAGYFERAGTYPGDKYVRRYRERRDAAFRRFRITHTPFDGLYTPERWPHGREVYETFAMQLPTDLDETVYDLQFKLGYQTLVPNFSIRDLLYNEDSFVAAKCAELRIKRIVIR